MKPRKPTWMFALFAIAAASALAFHGGAAVACTPVGDSPSPKVVAAGVDAVNLAVCVLQHDGEPAEQIVLDCGKTTLHDVEQLLGAHEKALMRRRAALCASPPAK